MNNLVVWRKNIKVILYEGVSKNKSSIKKVINKTELDLRFRNSLEALDYLELVYGNGERFGKGVVFPFNKKKRIYKIGNWKRCVDGNYLFKIQLAEVVWINDNKSIKKRFLNLFKRKNKLTIEKINEFINLYYK
ncbi:hypothetical protein ACFSCX_09750 [Bacillus salitolerans]|uniref:Uncharacterized protein n=1 Tax=Bacillus salitolerans TaxID=1437434 RepID=A0ABW4LNR3_9BACI